MRILQITRQFYPCTGGIETVVLRLCEQFSDLGHDVHVITLKQCFESRRLQLSSQEMINGIPVRRVNYFGSRRYAIAPTTIRYLAGYDVIHVHSSDFFLDYLAATASIHRVPIVLSTHGMYFHTSGAQRIKELYFKSITRLSLSAVSLILCDSNQDRDLLSKIVPQKKLRLQPNGIDYERFSTVMPQNRKRLQFVTVGRLVSNKRIDRLIQTFANIRFHADDAHLNVIGPDWGEKEALLRLLRELNLESSVSILDELPNDHLLKELGSATFWLSASEYESFGIALLEAMAAGCIPLVQPLPAFKQLVEEGHNGYFIDYRQPVEAANRILELASLPKSDCIRLAENARHSAAKYAWLGISQEVLSAYLEVRQ